MNARNSKKRETQDEDLRHEGPFNVDRAPTGEFVPKGSIKSPINRYGDSKGRGRQQDEDEGHSRRRSRATSKNKARNERSSK